MATDGAEVRLVADDAAKAHGAMLASAPMHRNALRVRWLVLALLCMALVGSYYSYDNPTATEDSVSVASRRGVSGAPHGWRDRS